MRAHKRWDGSGTCAYVTVVGELPVDAETSLVYHELQDGVSTILTPIGVPDQQRDGSEERVAIHDVAEAENLSASVDNLTDYGG